MDGECELTGTVLAASARLWMILGKRGGFKKRGGIEKPIAGVAGAPAALLKRSRLQNPTIGVVQNGGDILLV